MGKTETAMGVLLAGAGYRVTVKPPAASTADMGCKASSEALDIYGRLQGIQERTLLTSGRWDIAVEGNLLIEVDEQEHFNRHRATTLEGTSYPWTADYRRYCTEHESRCRTYGGYWASGSSSAMFGPASPQGDHTGVGAPRWRQRALYDAVRDVWARDNQVWKLARVSIYDVVDGVRFRDVLDGRSRIAPERLREMIESRTLA
ncbi:DUF7255 family protein [Arthrobacter caoxuetaonis]|uniref:Uncharacterized protein n=1 Tax=Arthrobacter caoxuetaonis TaxID=2886935 RepID=A0A9X1SDP8_9MICC|nr:hypothetical protein [Arthrobacter caoxuetaonis]MCC3299413.1 hypothetical protein [Arthrobacter caoxuetaonis]USQ59094.1 hypothetical protein NF551_18485 [Arthrobacter caoxuetaonis]